MFEDFNKYYSLYQVKFRWNTHIEINRWRLGRSINGTTSEQGESIMNPMIVLVKSRSVRLLVTARRNRSRLVRGRRGRSRRLVIVRRRVERTIEQQIAMILILMSLIVLIMIDIVKMMILSSRRDFNSLLMNSNLLSPASQSSENHLGLFGHVRRGRRREVVLSV